MPPVVTQEQLNEAKALGTELQNAIDVEQQQISNFIAGQAARIAELEAEVAAGGSSETLLEITAQMTASIADVKATLPDLPEPEPEPEV